MASVRRTKFRIDLPMDQIAAFCQRNRIRKLSLFGSVLRDDFSPESDIDVLVEFEPDTVVGYKFINMQDELSELLQREVDLNTPDFLSRHFRQRVLQTAQVIYERQG
ncbi:MAG: nucleotidyltransferase family protein [Anaerolineae bacterium]|nr:nucleotidyltransferase family protein [Anaerolineae bacterium]